MNMGGIPENGSRKRIKQIEVMAARAIRETPDTMTLVLFTGNDTLDYLPGHFLTIDPHQFNALDRFINYFEDIKGKKEPPRAYSLASSPDEKYLAITIKEERYEKGVTKYPPLLSPLLVCRTPVGTKMTITGFTGPYTLDDDKAKKVGHIYHICAGSGIVPNFSILKHSLRNHTTIKHTLIYSNKTYNDIIFRKPLDELAGEHSGKLRIHYFLTREENPQRYGEHFHEGRITQESLKRLIKPDGVPFYYLCGPAISKYDKIAAKEKGKEARPRFMETVLISLEQLGIPGEQIKKESYG